jgi:hypothetical protein
VSIKPKELRQAQAWAREPTPAQVSEYIANLEAMLTDEINAGLDLPHKANVTPIPKPERKKKTPGLKRTRMERKPSKLKTSLLGHCTIEQKARVAERVCICCGKHFDECDPAHVIPRAHPKLSKAAADDVRAVVPLCRQCHEDFDDGMDLLPYLEPAWRDSQEWAAGAVGLASAMRSIGGERP